jgi:hypothetical protein
LRLTFCNWIEGNIFFRLRFSSNWLSSLKCFFAVAMFLFSLLNVLFPVQVSSKYCYLPVLSRCSSSYKISIMFVTVRAWLRFLWLRSISGNLFYNSLLHCTQWFHEWYSNAIHILFKIINTTIEIREKLRLTPCKNF